MINIESMIDDVRFRKMVDAVAYGVMDEYPALDYDRYNAMRDVAIKAAWDMLKMVYENDGELVRLREECDAYKQMALEAHHLKPMSFVIQTLDNDSHK